MFDLVLTVSNSHFLPVSVTSSSTMVKLQPLLCLYPPPSPRSLSGPLFQILWWWRGFSFIECLFSLCSLSLSLSLSGLDLLPGSCPLPRTWRNASPVWRIYVFLFDPIKRVVSRVFTSEFNLERELPVLQWGAMIPLPPSLNSSMASISFIFIIKSKTLGLAYKVWSVPIVLVSLLVSCWSCSPLSHGLPQDMCTCYFCLKCSSSSSFLVFT